MNITIRSSSLAIGSHTHPGEARVQAEHLPGTDRWMVDLEAVDWLLERVEAGDVTVAEVRSWIQGATRWESGCCHRCDDAAESYEQAQRLSQELLQRWQRDQDAMTPETHPYLLNGSTVHAWDCRLAVPTKPDDYTTTLHTYAVALDGVGRGTTGVLEYAWERSNRSRRITAEELTTRLGRRRPTSRDPRCKRCSPPLPGPYRSEASSATDR